MGRMPARTIAPHPPAVIPAKAGTQLSPCAADEWVPALRRDDTCGCVTPCAKPHQFDSRSHQHSQALHPGFGATYARSLAPGVYSPHCTLIERLETNGRGRRAGWCGGRLAPGGTERIVRAFPGPGSGAGGHHDRCPSRSRWADRRPIPPERRRASTQGSHLSPLTVRAPGSQRRGDEPHCLRTTRVEAQPRRCSSPSGERRRLLLDIAGGAGERFRSPAPQRRKPGWQPIRLILVSFCSASGGCDAAI